MYKKQIATFLLISTLVLTGCASNTADKEADKKSEPKTEQKADKEQAKKIDSTKRLDMKKADDTQLSSIFNHLYVNSIQQDLASLEDTVFATTSEPETLKDDVFKKDLVKLLADKNIEDPTKVYLITDFLGHQYYFSKTKEVKTEEVLNSRVEKVLKTEPKLLKEYKNNYRHYNAYGQMVLKGSEDSVWDDYYNYAQSRLTSEKEQADTSKKK